MVVSYLSEMEASKVAYVTGGTKGIGLAVVSALIDSGWKVGFTGRSEESVNEALKDLDQNHVHGISADVRNRAAQKQAIAELTSKWGRLDLVVANAGIGHFASIEELTPVQWNEVVDVNLTGVFHTIQLSIPHLKQTEGYIMTIASLAGTNFFARGSAYNASKFGLVGFTQAVMLDLRKYGIKTTTIMPGSVSTHFNGRTPGEEDSWKIQPEDIGQIVLDLLAMHPRTLPSKVEVRPTKPPSK